MTRCRVKSGCFSQLERSLAHNCKCHCRYLMSSFSLLLLINLTAGKMMTMGARDKGGEVPRGGGAVEKRKMLREGLWP